MVGLFKTSPGLLHGELAGLLATVIAFEGHLAVGVGDDVAVTLAIGLVAAVGAAAVEVVRGVAVRFVNRLHLMTLVVGLAHDGPP